ncbi:unnamed protein product [Penicillium roqueforti FM164]|uniref:Genomic scaffold, ProqFM164S02 n=1 Tax=Penicillium roqueforti (strain FM164) TaxID=1365484 RepID=W6Q8F0_PENRF|nr:unnamed protein product [Penicillium roqueforti FM164]
MLVMTEISVGLQRTKRGGIPSASSSCDSSVLSQADQVCLLVSTPLTELFVTRLLPCGGR